MQEERCSNTGSNRGQNSLELSRTECSWSLLTRILRHTRLHPASPLLPSFPSFASAARMHMQEGRCEPCPAAATCRTRHWCCLRILTQTPSPRGAWISFLPFYPALPFDRALTRVFLQVQPPVLRGLCQALQQRKALYLDRVRSNMGHRWYSRYSTNAAAAAADV